VKTYLIALMVMLTAVVVAVVCVDAALIALAYRSGAVSGNNGGGSECRQEHLMGMGMATAKVTHGMMS
jgi:hypothetical protein